MEEDLQKVPYTNLESPPESTPSEISDPVSDSYALKGCQIKESLAKQPNPDKTKPSARRGRKAADLFRRWPSCRRMNLP